MQVLDIASAERRRQQFGTTVAHMKFAHVLPKCVACRNNNLDKYGQLSGPLLRSTPCVITKNFMQSALAAAVTPYHVYDGISVLRTAREHMVRRYYPVRNFRELRDIRALPTIPYGLDEGQNTRPARFKTKDIRFGH